jgi:O-antigen ligase
MTTPRDTSVDPALLLSVVLACCAPTLLAYNRPPSTSALNQCLAFALWGGVAAMYFTPIVAPRKFWAQLGPLLGAIGVMAAAVLSSWGFGALPPSLTLQALGMLAGSALLVISGGSAARGPNATKAFGAFALGLLVAGVANSAVAAVQIFAPEWADGNWIARSTEGRAIGNLRQANHLSSLLLWSLMAAVALHELRWLPRIALWALSVPIVWALELTGSRTGAASLLLLLGWGLLDRRLSRAARWWLASTPLLYAFIYASMTAFMGVSQKLTASAASTGRTIASGTWAAGNPNSRPNIWQNTIDLVAGQPWTGVGFGEFNLAWTLSSFPSRANIFFDNCHNLLLQLAVELGLPRAILVIALLVLALLQGLKRARNARGSAGLVASTGMLLVVMLMLHSMLEFPLWSAYFLMPAALAWGFVLCTPDETPEPVTPSPATRSLANALTAYWGLAAGVVMSLLGAWAMLDYFKVTQTFNRAYTEAETIAIIERGQHSPVYAHYVDYAAAVTGKNSQASIALGFSRAAHHLIDPQLMMAWSTYLAANGQVDQARWMAQRLREFRSPETQTFFAPCRDATSTAFQCQWPASTHSWREFGTPVTSGGINAPAVAGPASSR